MIFVQETVFTFYIKKDVRTKQKIYINLTSLLAGVGLEPTTPGL